MNGNRQTPGTVKAGNIQHVMNLMYLGTALGFSILTALFFGLVLRHLRVALTKTGWTEERQKRVQVQTMLIIILWAVVVAVGSFTGFTQRFDLFPANLAPMLLIPLAGMLVITFSKSTGQLLQVVPIKTLTYLQVFRVFVEILLWMLFLQNIIPVQMTFEGLNFDIVAGITAPVMAYFFSGNKKVMIVWNIVCLGLLINIVTIAILSTPTFLRVFMNEPANTIVTVFPFIFLPAFLVPLAYGLHFLSLRKLMMKPG
ncbi:MAG: hypothetical protein HRU69_03270 [Flammeovirgaceae bacterium]|nr:MAG: hypothetical protein HRU69_03270 [Flammeovirgaceae bacterium]